MAGPVVVAIFRAQEGHEATVRTALDGLVTPTHEEEGCIKYAVHRDTNDPRTFALVEVWRSQDDLDAHFTRPHMQGLGDLFAEHLDGTPVIHFCEPLGVGTDEKGLL